MSEENKKKILVVDDDENLRLVLVDKFNASGFSAVGAKDGEEGLGKALEMHPDLILLDILMPVMDGWEMLGKLRADDWGKGVKVVMLTVVEDAEAVAKAMSDGSFTYLIKTDHSIDQVVEAVEKMLEK